MVISTDGIINWYQGSSQSCLWWEHHGNKLVHCYILAVSWGSLSLINLRKLLQCCRGFIYMPDTTALKYWVAKSPLLSNVICHRDWFFFPLYIHRAVIVAQLSTGSTFFTLLSWLPTFFKETFPDSKVGWHCNKVQTKACSILHVSIESLCIDFNGLWIRPEENGPFSSWASNARRLILVPVTPLHLILIGLVLLHCYDGFTPISWLAPTCCWDPSENVSGSNSLICSRKSCSRTVQSFFCSPEDQMQPPQSTHLGTGVDGHPRILDETGRLSV